MTLALIIRRYELADFDAVNDLWRRARLRAFPDLQARKGHTAEEDRKYFREVVLVRHVWVAEVDGRATGFLAIAPVISSTSSTSTLITSGSASGAP